MNLSTPFYRKKASTYVILALLSVGINAGTGIKDAQAAVTHAQDASSDYAVGLRAYLRDDYVLAQQSWLRAAKNDKAEHNKAKAMFNLGLLHEKNVIKNSSAQKAETWFLLAGKHGYTAAYNHYGHYLLAQGREQEAITVLKRAAVKGFYSSRKKLQALGVLKESTSAKSTPSTALAPNSSRKDKAANKKNLAVDEYKKWIVNQPSRNWTIQLVAFPERQKVEAFIKQNNLRNDVAYFLEKTSSGASLYKLIYGSYSSKVAADKGRKSLSAKLIEQGPWLRSMQSVKEAIKAT